MWEEQILCACALLFSSAWTMESNVGGADPVRMRIIILLSMDHGIGINMQMLV